MSGSGLDARHLLAYVLTDAVAVVCCLWLIFGRVACLMTWNLFTPSLKRNSGLWFTWTLPLLTLTFGCLVTCGSRSYLYGLWSLGQRSRKLTGKFSGTPGRCVSGLLDRSFGLLGACA